MKSNLLCVILISVFFQLNAQAQSSRPINDPADTRADTYLTRSIENATFTQRDNATKVTETTRLLRVDHLKENKIELIDDPMAQSSRPINDPADTRADANLTRSIENATFTQRDNATRVRGTTRLLQVDHLNEAQSSRPINEPADTRAEANLTRRRNNATFTHRDNATRVMRTTRRPQMDQLRENEIEPKGDPMAQSSRPRNDPADIRVDTYLTKRIKNTTFTPRDYATRVMGTTVKPQVDQLKEAQSPLPINVRADTRAEANRTRRIDNTTFTQRDNATRAKGTTLRPQVDQLNEAQSPLPINESADTRAEANRTRRIDNTTFTQRDNATRVMGTTLRPQVDQLNENEIEHKGDPFDKSSPMYLQKMANRTKLYLECAEETGVSPEMILFLRSGKWYDDKPTLKDWVLCVLVKNELMTDQGVLRLDVAFRNLSKLQKSEIEENIDKCLPTRRMKPLEISWRFAKCFQKQDPQNSLF